MNDIIERISNLLDGMKSECEIQKVYLVNYFCQIEDILNELDHDISDKEIDYNRLNEKCNELHDEVDSLNGEIQELESELLQTQHELNLLKKEHSN